MAIEIVEDFKTIVNSKKLDQYFMPTKYPNVLPGGVPSRFFNDPQEAKLAMLLAKNIMDLVKKKLILYREGTRIFLINLTE